jgi:hypothetical protein
MTKVKKAGGVKPSRRITVEPKGISVSYVPCQKCPEFRSDERAVVIDPGQSMCRMCYGIDWQRKHPVKIYKKKVRAKAKTNGGIS